MALVSDVGSVIDMFTAGNFAAPLAAAAIAVSGLILKRAGGVDAVLDRFQTHRGTAIRNVARVVKTIAGKMVLGFVSLVLLLSTMGYRCGWAEMSDCSRSYNCSQHYQRGNPR